MADYDRLTALTMREVWERTEQILTTQGELALSDEGRHERTYAGREGRVHVEAHRHGPMTQVTIRTDRLRTSKVDGVVRYLMNQLPYQPGDPPRD
jgi:mono/diheme cytochrome c family protein